MQIISWRETPKQAKHDLQRPFLLRVKKLRGKSLRQNRHGFQPPLFWCLAYFFLPPLSLKEVSILAPIPSSIALTSPACGPVGASSRYLLSASLVPGGTIKLPFGSNLPSLIP